MGAIKDMRVIIRFVHLDVVDSSADGLDAVGDVCPLRLGKALDPVTTTLGAQRPDLDGQSNAAPPQIGHDLF